MERIVKIYSSNADKILKCVSSATTWGELKTDLDRDGIEYEKNSVVVKENKTSLELDDALLPEGEFTLRLTPKNIKSGADNINTNDVDKWSYEQVKTYCKTHNVPYNVNQKKTVIIANIKSHLANTTKSVGSEQEINIPVQYTSNGSFDLEATLKAMADNIETIAKETATIKSFVTSLSVKSENDDDDDYYKNDFDYEEEEETQLTAEEQAELDELNELRDASKWTPRN